MPGVPASDLNLRFWRLNDAGEPEPCDVLEWSAFLDSGRQQIVLTESRGWYVSTIFAGYILHLGGAPFFESMAFFEDGSNSLQDRYATREEALAGHEQMVVAARQRMGLTGDQHGDITNFFSR